MKINDNHRIGALHQYRRSSVETSATTGRNVRGKDQLSISNEAKAMLESGQSERVQQLKKAVEEGDYHVDAGKLAEKLLPYL